MLRQLSNLLKNSIQSKENQIEETIIYIREG